MCHQVRVDVWVSSFRDATGTFDAKGLTPCECGSDAWEKLPAAPNFSVKGYSAKNNYGVKSE